MMSDKKRIAIKDWDVSDRPREKMLNKGKQALTDAELIAILMGSGNRSESAVELAQRILREHKNNLIEISKLSIHDLMKFRGIGQAKAISIVAALELGYRRLKSEVIEKKAITTSKNAFDYMNCIIGDSQHEEFWILLLDRANQIIGEKNISKGGLSATVVDPKKIFSIALENKASNIILCHNHPSGNLKPSQQDNSITEKIVNAGKLLEINILDHIIIGKNSYFSYADEGQL